MYRQKTQLRNSTTSPNFVFITRSNHYGKSQSRLNPDACKRRTDSYDLSHSHQLHVPGAFQLILTIGQIPRIRVIMTGTATGVQKSSVARVGALTLWSRHSVVVIHGNRKRCTSFRNKMRRFPVEARRTASSIICGCLGWLCKCMYSTFT